MILIDIHVLIWFATARARGLPLLTADRLILAYPHVRNV